MFLKTLGKYVLMPGAGVAMLAGFGMFDLGKGAAPTSAGPGGLTSVEDAGDTIMSALEGPLGVAKRIAMAGSSAIGMDPNQLPDFLKNAQGPAPTHQVPGAGMPAIPGVTGAAVMAQPAVAVQGVSRQSSAGFASARPPSATE